MHESISPDRDEYSLQFSRYMPTNFTMQRTSQHHRLGQCLGAFYIVKVSVGELGTVLKQLKFWLPTAHGDVYRLYHKKGNEYFLIYLLLETKFEAHQSFNKMCVFLSIELSLMLNQIPADKNVTVVRWVIMMPNLKSIQSLYKEKYIDIPVQVFDSQHLDACAHTHIQWSNTTYLSWKCRSTWIHTTCGKQNLFRIIVVWWHVQQINNLWNLLETVMTQFH